MQKFKLPNIPRNTILSIPELHEFIVRLRGYLQAMYNCELSSSQLQVSGLNATVTASNVNFDIMIRVAKSLDSWPENAMVIKRLGFSEVGAGNGKHFLHFLTRLAKDYNFTHIGIEELNPALGELFRSYGFTTTSGNNFIRPIR